MPHAPCPMPIAPCPIAPLHFLREKIEILLPRVSYSVKNKRFAEIL
ncbi:hypothetical protein G4P69_08955 [Aetokthonos hydrillicola CCALA 1050]|nr:hypothetical protein [Aetokthonos hydrillicola CCALA 1050]